MVAYIHHVRIDEFRTIKDLDIDLRPKPEDVQGFRHLILTGPNGSGKSSTLLFLAQSINQRRRDVITWSTAPVETTVVMIMAHRPLHLDDVRGPLKVEFPAGMNVRNQSAKFLLQYLVNRKTEAAFANLAKNSAQEAEIQAWFDQFQDNLRWLFEDTALVLEFDSKNFDFKIHRGDGSIHGFQHLADGHASFLAILAEILLGIEATRVASGVVILDEIESHLHLRLQEQALPFLTSLFPGFQFITATHSPAVISSVPDAVVYDMARHKATPSEEFVGVPFGTLMTAHFKMPSEFDLDSTTKLEELRSLAVTVAQPAKDERCQELAGLLSRRSSTLAYEVWRILHEPKPTRGQDD